MIIEFRVRNYRSIKDEQVLSLMASADKELSAANTRKISAPSTLAVVNTAVIYGANASGKTTVLRALQFMRGMVLESAHMAPTQTFNVQPFLLDVQTPKEPTLLEVTVAIGDVRYQYGFEFTAQRIVSEWLLVYQAAKPQVWFDRRTVHETEYDYTFGSYLTGLKTQWKMATRPNSLFLSMAVLLNSDKLRPLYDWFVGGLQVNLDGGQVVPNFTTEMIERQKGPDRVAGLMSAADIAIADISTYRQKATQAAFTFDLATGAASTHSEETEIVQPRFRHTVGEVSADFELGDESQGSQKLYALAGPLFDVIEKGAVLVIDELDRSLHPKLVRKIIEAFQNPDLNKNGAQLLFTTHDTSLLDTTLLRRDQIWFTEKRYNQATELVPLSDFSPRKNEALEKGYLSGRYGGIPFLESVLFTEAMPSDETVNDH